MRLIRNIILIVVALVLLASAYSYLSLFIKQNITGSDESSLESSQLKEASVKIAYTLKKDVWLSFPLQANEEKLRILSNAIIENNYEIDDKDRFLYSINYEILDDKNKIIKNGRFYHRASQKKYQDVNTGKSYVSTSIYPATENPLDSRIHILNLRGLENADKIRLKAGEFQYPIKRIIVRSYQKKKITERKLDYAWQRMGDERRQSLAKVSVYNADIINDKEKKQLVSNQWAPMGPLGVDDEDYFVQKIYVVREIENDIQLNVDSVPSNGMVIYPNRYGVITLPEANNNIKFTWELFSTQKENSQSGKIKVEWWGHPATQYKNLTVQLIKNEFHQFLQNGVIRLSADKPIVVRVWKVNLDNSATEITPKAAYLRLFSPASPGLVYKINHINGYKSPYRFDVRSFSEQKSYRIEYQLLDKYDRIIKKGYLNPSQELSPYDAVVADTDRWLTEPQRFYFNLPKEVKKIRFNSEAGIWVSAFTRPKNLAHSITDPLNADERKTSIPVWFAVRPHNWKSYLIKGRSQLITIQRHPPKINQQLLAGQYNWQQFLPDHEWKGRYVLNELEGRQVFREEALSSRFHLIDHNIENEIEFVSKYSASSIRPKLIYSRDIDKEDEVSIYLNDKLLYKSLIIGKTGEIQLPYIKPGRYKFRISLAGNADEESSVISSYRLFVNYIKAENNLFIKRMAINVADNGLTFNVLKESNEELLALRVYTPTNNNNDFQIDIKINGIDGRPIGPLYDWTVGRRTYKLKDLKNNKRPIMLNTDKDIKAERLFFIPIGNDVVKNEYYQVEVKLDSDVNAYVLLTRTLPGMYPNRYLYSDIELEEVE